MFRGVDRAIGEVIIHTARTTSVRQRTESFSARGEDHCCVGLVRHMVAEKLLKRPIVIPAKAGIQIRISDQGVVKTCFDKRTGFRPSPE